MPLLAAYPVVYWVGGVAFGSLAAAYAYIKGDELKDSLVDGIDYVAPMHEQGCGFAAEGYAKEASEDFKKKQEELLSETLKKIDIVVCTALIPGKKAPVILKENMIDNMQSGSIIYDLAAVQGGNTALTKVDEIVEKKGVRIMGDSNILNKLPISASTLYAKNVFNFVSNLLDKESNKININLEDEIIKKTLVK